MTGPVYLPRLVDPLLVELLGAFPAVSVVGPRACGKTTTAARLVAQVDRLDQPGTAEVYRLDPDAALRRAARPLLIDEFQIVPEVLAAVKRAVDADPTPGQFVLTGSARAGLDHEFNAATGRVVNVQMQGLTEREIEGTPGPPFLSRLLSGGVDALTDPVSAPDIDEYLTRALRSGFPEPALRLATSRDRRRWLRAYLDNVATRDAAALGQGKDPAKLLRYLQVLALNSGGVVSNKTLFERAEVDHRTADGYDALLQALHLTEDVPAWPRTLNRQRAMAQRRKRYVVDSGLAAVAASLTEPDVLADPDLIGRFFDAFGFAQLRAEAAVSEDPPRLHHLRTARGDVELDLVLDLGRRRAVGVEFKAAARVNAADARHLATLRDDMGDDFLAGVVLYSGTHVVELGNRLYGVPLCCLWLA